jgi:hypothetical protein
MELKQIIDNLFLGLILANNVRVVKYLINRNIISIKDPICKKGLQYALCNKSSLCADYLINHECDSYDLYMCDVIS